MTVDASPASPAFVHLHTHSEYSLLDGMGRIADLVAAAKADGQTALAITDHGTLAGAWKFAHACRAAGIKPVLGQELYLSIGSRFDPQTIQVPRETADLDGDETAGSTKRKTNEHLTVLATTPAGWLNLVKINNAAQETFKGKPLADFELLRRYGEGLIVLTGCLGGPVAGYAARGEIDQAEQNLLALVEAVGSENVYVEIMDHGIDLEGAALRPLADLAIKHGLTLVATNDAHYVHGRECGTHEVWLAAQSKSTLASPSRFRFHGTGYHLRTEQEMRALHPTSRRWQEACAATVEVAARIDDWVLPPSRYRMPRFARPDDFDSAESYLHHLVLAGAKHRYGTPLPAAVKQRLRHEEDVINSLGYAEYFLIVWEMVAWARSRGILVGPGRGSACGSSLAYCLRITDVEPLAANLLFERFLEPGRTDMPDIDVDFEQRRIPEIHAHLRALYGADCVARLGTFAMARSRRAIKDVARVNGRNDLGNKMAKAIPMDQGKPFGLTTVLNPTVDAGRAFRDLVAADPIAESILDDALIIENAVLGAGIHACGVIVSGEPLRDLIPLRKDRQGEFKDEPAHLQPWVTDWDGKDTEAFGLLKLDALFLRSLDVLAETSRIIAETTGERVDFAELPDTSDMSDPRVRKTWELLREGRTSAVFQMEGGGIRDLLVGSSPSSLQDLSAVSALYRPGPMSAGMGERYVQRKSGREAIGYGIFTDDPDEQHWLATVLEPTVGLAIYQEQSMLLGTVVAGFDAAGRAKLRRAIGKKKSDLMAEVGTAFLAGAVREFLDENGTVISPVFRRSTAVRIWDMLKGSAEYQFNASHSFAYGQVTFLTAYAKANWPSQAAAAVLACTRDDGKRRRVLLDLAADGIQVAPPDINQARSTTSVGSDGRLRLGLTEIRDVGKAAGILLAERQARGPFLSLADLMARLEGQAVTARTVEALVEAGALDTFGPRKGLMMALRAEATDPLDAEWGGLERSERQRARLGVRVGEHPLTPHRDTLRDWRTEDAVTEDGTPMGRRARSVAALCTTELPPRGREIVVAGVLTRWERTVSRIGPSARFDVEGDDGSWVEGVMWNDDLLAQEKAGVPQLGSVVSIEGWLKRQTIEVRVSDTDGADIDARDQDGTERTTKVEVLRLRADNITTIKVDDEPRLMVPAAPRIDLRAALHRARTLVAARKGARHRKGSTAPQPGAPRTPSPTAAAPSPTRAPARGERRSILAGTAESSTAGSLVSMRSRPGARKVIVADQYGAWDFEGVSSRSGRIDPQQVFDLVPGGVAGGRVISTAKAHPGRVLRLNDDAEADLFVVALPLDELPAQWHQMIFEAIDALTLSDVTRVGRVSIPTSTAALDPACLGRPPQRPLLIGLTA